jgi:acid phosphatase (class A)
VFANVIGPKFTMADLPLTAALSANVHNDEAIVTGPLKAHYKRPRPFLFDSTLHPVCRIDNDTAYPSGHSLSGYLLAFTVAEIVPEKTQEILQRADDYAHNRMVCGVHYQSDIEASRRVAYTMFGYMMANPRFRGDLAAARTETRTRLGLPPIQ